MDATESNMDCGHKFFFTLVTAGMAICMYNGGLSVKARAHKFICYYV